LLVFVSKKSNKILLVYSNRKCPVFFFKHLITLMYESFSSNYFQSQQEERLYGRLQNDLVVLGENIHVILMLIIVIFWCTLKDNVYNSNPQTEEEFV
jgi:hypothetical protein